MTEISSSRLLKDQRKVSIRKAALKKMLETSVESVSIRAIAKEANISETLLYRFYRNKYAIVYDIFQNEFLGVLEKTEEILDAVKVMVTDLEVSLPAMGKFLKKTLTEYQGILMLNIKESENIEKYILKGKPVGKRKIDKKMGLEIHYFISPTNFKVLIDFFRRSKKDGNLKENLDPEICAMLLLTVVWQTTILNPYRFLHEKIDESYFDLLLDTQIQILVDGMKRN
ncbi:MAG: TetR/AcrR family transcriptional regulator [Candidatus Heimdallarchaeota archaeon]|nr:TetR/AcrR family transcriptional regulator [Candidatus Heimdallarchaeota archaeon]